MCRRCARATRQAHHAGVHHRCADAARPKTIFPGHCSICRPRPCGADVRRASRPSKRAAGSGGGHGGHGEMRLGAPPSAVSAAPVSASAGGQCADNLTKTSGGDLANGRARELPAHGPRPREAPVKYAPPCVPATPRSSLDLDVSRSGRANRAPAAHATRWPPLWEVDEAEPAQRTRRGPPTTQTMTLPPVACLVSGTSSRSCEASTLAPPMPSRPVVAATSLLRKEAALARTSFARSRQTERVVGLWWSAGSVEDLHPSNSSGTPTRPCTIPRALCRGRSALPLHGPPHVKCQPAGKTCCRASHTSPPV